MPQAPSPEEQLENLLLSRRRGLEEQVTQLRRTIADLERREALLRDSRASVERVLRVGTNDLDLRESELASTIRVLEERQERLVEAEAELARRRSELGAVELKRETVEQRERALAEREQRVSEREAEFERRAQVRPEVAMLAFVPGAAYRLVEIDATPLTVGAALQLEGSEFVTARIGRSPLPGDERSCAYLVASPRLS